MGGGGGGGQIYAITVINELKNLFDTLVHYLYEAANVLSNHGCNMSAQQVTNNEKAISTLLTEQLCSYENNTSCSSLFS